jgi:putative membrane protein
MLGGHYTYAKVPLGFWMQDLFHFTRNHYDRIGHFAQGFVPAMIAREILIRWKVINGAVWRAVLAVAVCLAISALYELLEWRVSVMSGSAGDAFLGTQGDVWEYARGYVHGPDRLHHCACVARPYSRPPTAVTI